MPQEKDPDYDLPPNLAQIAEQAEEDFVRQDSHGKGGGAKKTSSGNEAYKQTAAYQEKKRYFKQKKELFRQLNATFEPGKFKHEHQRQLAIKVYVDWLQLITSNYNQPLKPYQSQSFTPQINLDHEIATNNIETTRFGSKKGHGGQNVNKRDTAIRLVHLPTQIRVNKFVQERSQEQNLSGAQKILSAKLQDHLNLWFSVFPAPQNAQEYSTYSNQLTFDMIKTFISSPPQMPKN